MQVKEALVVQEQQKRNVPEFYVSLASVEARFWMYSWDQYVGDYKVSEKFYKDAREIM